MNIPLRVTFKRIALPFAGILLAFGLFEVAVRVVCHRDEDGNYYFFNRRLPPQIIPLSRIKRVHNGYLASDTTRIIYDPDLGWSHRPNSRAEEGFYQYNSVGIRSEPREYDRYPPPRTLRIALFGDSFTHCYEVPFRYSWGYMLEQELRRAGYRVEVLNFGVGGYGMDQAFLRWRRDGRPFHPHIVLFGFMAENAKRNVNMIRMIYNPISELSVTKPRFILDGRNLSLINVPTVPPDRIIETISRLDDWKWVSHEYFYQPHDRAIWFNSKLIALLSENRYIRQYDRMERDFYSPSNEGGGLALRIVQEFQREAVQAGSKFYVVHIPQMVDLRDMVEGRTLPYAELLAAIDQQCHVIHPEHRMREAARMFPVETFYEKESHFSALTNRIVSESILDFFMSQNIQFPSGATQ